MPQAIESTAAAKSAISAPVNAPRRPRALRTVRRRPATVQAQRQGNVLGDGERWQQVEGLEYEPDPLAPQDRQPPLAQVRQVGIAERNAPGGGPVQPRRHVQECALARTGWPHDRGERPRGECGADAVEGDDRSFAPAIGLADIAQGDRRSRAGSLGCAESRVEHEANVRARPPDPHRREAGFRLLPADDRRSYLGRRRGMRGCRTFNGNIRPNGPGTRPSRARQLPEARWRSGAYPRPGRILRFGCPR